MVRGRSSLVVLAAVFAALRGEAQPAVELLHVVEVPVETSTGQVVVLDGSDDGSGVDYLDIKRWEAAHGRITNGAFVLLRGQGARFSREGVEYLAKWRDPALLGAVEVAPEMLEWSDVPLWRIDAPVLPAVGAEGRLDGAVLSVRVAARPKPTPVAGEKHLIEFGWDIPNERTLADAAAAGTPFSGAVFEPQMEIGQWQRESFTWMTWGTRRVQEHDIARVVSDLEATPASFRAHSFVRFNVTPGHVDWFDDFGAVLHNVRAAARISRDAGLGGILFDVEQYEGQLWDYGRHPPGRSFEEYEAQVEARGRAFGAAVAEVHPSVTILLTFGYSLSDRVRERAHYGLLPAFLDGMIEGGGAEMELIDGYEYSYPFKSRLAFERGRAEIVDDSDGRLGVGFGLWMDWMSGVYGWHPDAHELNWHSPESFGEAVGHALSLSDRYVWIYTERLNWWTGEKLPGAYLRALGAAVRGVE